MATGGQFCWPPAGTFVAAYGQFFMAANRLRPGHEIEVLDDGLVITRGVIENLSLEQGIIRLKLSYGRGRRTYRRRDGWEVRMVCHEGRAQPETGTTPERQFEGVRG